MCILSRWQCIAPHTTKKMNLAGDNLSFICPILTSLRQLTLHLWISSNTCQLHCQVGCKLAGGVRHPTQFAELAFFFVCLL